MNTFRTFISSAVVDNIVVKDASRILSLECFQQWSLGRCDGLIGLEKKYQRCITAHLTACKSPSSNSTDHVADGRRPFHADEEEALLQVVRLKRPWSVMARSMTDARNRPAFAGSEFATIGSKGFRALGHHERLQADTSSCAKVARASSRELAQAMARSEIELDSLTSLFDDLDYAECDALPQTLDSVLADENDLHMDALASMLKLDVTGPQNGLGALPASVHHEVLPADKFFAAISAQSVLTVLSPQLLAQIPAHAADGAIPRIALALLPPQSNSAPKVIVTFLPRGI
jgi:hypothetical protein